MVFLKKNLLTMLLMSFVFVLGSAASPGDAQAESKIAYSCNDGGLDIGGLCLANLDGSSATRIVTIAGGLSANGNVDAVSWSPDGANVLFATGGQDSDSRRLWSVNSDGTNLVEITPAIPSCCWETGGVAWSPELPSSLASVSPFGQFLIVFVLGGMTALWMMRRNSRVVSVHPTR